MKKDYAPAIVGLAAFVAVLIAIVVLLMNGQKPEGIAMIGMGGALTAIASGFGPSFSNRGNSQVTNADKAIVTNEQTGKEETK